MEDIFLNKMALADWWTDVIRHKCKVCMNVDPSDASTLIFSFLIPTRFYLKTTFVFLLRACFCEDIFLVEK